jgi:hypothetical protein
VSSAPTPPDVLKSLSGPAALDLASFAAYVQSGHAALEAAHDAERYEDDLHRLAGDLPPDSGEDVAFSGPFLAHRPSALPDRATWLTSMAADMRPFAGVPPGPTLLEAEHQAQERAFFAAPHDEELREQPRFDSRSGPVARATLLGEVRADGPPVFELTPEPPRRLALQAVAAGVAGAAPGAEAVEAETTFAAVLPAVARLEIDPAHHPVLPWWMPRPPNIEVPGLPGLVTARQDKPLFAGAAPRSPNPAGAAMDATAVGDFAYQRFEWDEDFGFNPWNPAPQAVLSGATP